MQKQPRLLQFTSLLAVSAAGIESVLLATVPNSIYREGLAAAALAVFGLLFLWISGIDLVAQAANAIEKSSAGNRALRIGLRTLFGCLAGLLFITYCSSWGTYFRAEQFANVDGFRFILENPFDTTWLYLGTGERAVIVLALATTILIVPIAAYFCPRIATLATPPSTEPKITQAALWRTSAALVLTSMYFVYGDPNPVSRNLRLDTARSGISPIVTLAVATVEAIREEPIGEHLEDNELQPITKWAPPATDKTKRPNILFIAVESLRADVVYRSHQGIEVTPNLNRLAKAGLNFTRAYSQSTHSDYADVCIVSSLYPLRTREHHYYKGSDPWPKTLAFDVFKAADYSTAIISAQNESWGGMDRFLETPNLDLFYDAKRYKENHAPGAAASQLELTECVFDAFGCLPDAHTMDTALQWITRQNDDNKPFFLSMNFQSSHFPYELPESVDEPFQPCELDSDVTFLSYPIEKKPQVQNAYYNALHYVDLQLGRMIQQLEDMNILDDTILVVMGENGEAFHENGFVGHADEPVQPAIHVANIIHAPKYLKPRVEEYPTELIDLLPTVMGMINWPSHPNFQGIDVFAENRASQDERLLFFHTNSAIARADAVLLGGRWKYRQNLRTGQTGLYDIDADPIEATDVSAKHPQLARRLDSVLNNWRNRQLAYYHHRRYYKNAYPPAAPRWEKNVGSFSLPATILRP
ncbi:MAG: sulfatase [Planctomycetaceae bacterium]